MLTDVLMNHISSPRCFGCEMANRCVTASTQPGHPSENLRSLYWQWSLPLLGNLSVLFVCYLTRVGPAAGIEEAQSVSWPDGVKYDPNHDWFGFISCLVFLCCILFLLA